MGNSGLSLGTGTLAIGRKTKAAGSPWKLPFVANSMPLGSPAEPPSNPSPAPQPPPSTTPATTLTYRKSGF
uniref:Uncharacterized protein n=1 Tax=Vespula pensylvanica TaxID=30213 RepID=A0A834NQK6_VESPE|nr:hypothetical protein H0235_012127 [Vespula pensylvanica]